MKKVLNFLKNNYKIYVPIIIIAIPFIIFAIALISASMNSNKVINGNRYRNDLDPAIEQTSIDDTKSAISSMTNVENADVILKTSQLRIIIDVNDSLSSEEYESLINDAYSKVNEIIPISTYFTKKTTGEKMYDLEITAYNQLTNDDTLIMYSLVKNSTMEEPIISLTSDPKDPDLVEELKLKEQQALEGTNDTPETTPQFEEKLEDEETEEIVEETPAE